MSEPTKQEDKNEKSICTDPCSLHGICTLRLAMHKLPIKCKFAVREDPVKEDGTNEG